MVWWYRVCARDSTGCDEIEAKSSESCIDDRPVAWSQVAYTNFVRSISKEVKEILDNHHQQSEETVVMDLNYSLELTWSNAIG